MQYWVLSGPLELVALGQFASSLPSYLRYAVKLVSGIGPPLPMKYHIIYLLFVLKLQEDLATSGKEREGSNSAMTPVLIFDTERNPS